MKSILCFFPLVLLFHFTFSQSVGIGTSNPNSSAQLDVFSTSKGLLAPRMTTIQKNAIATPAAGLMVYDTNLSAFYFYNGSTWLPLASNSSSSPWIVSNTAIYNSNSGNVGVGITAPLQKFHLAGNFLQDNGTVTLNNAAGIVQFQNAGVNKSFIQLAGNNLRIGTNAGNGDGKFVVRVDGSDKVLVDSTGNMQVIGEQDASLTSHGYLTLGNLTGDNLILDNNEIMARNNGSADDLILQNDGGNLGIGVPSPADKVDVDGSLRLTGGSRALKFETSLAGGMATRYTPGVSFIRTDGTLLGRMEYVDTINATNFIRLRMGSGIENGITLNSSNNTGIGTNNPQARLHIRGEAGVDEIAINSGVGSASESAAIQFYNSTIIGGGAATKKGYFLLDENDIKTGTNSGNTTGKFIIRNNGADRVFVNAAGNVGIAVADPTAKLHIAGAGIIDNGTSDALTLTGRLSVARSGEVIKIDGTNNSINFYNAGAFKSFISHSATGLYLGVNDGNIRLDVTNGHVAIGTVALPAASSNAYKLAVNGKVICEEVKVKLADNGGWPDYVFADTYKLRSLNEVETFIQENKHLPNIPSAATVQKEGIEVGDMQKRMIEKIEELTLYVIELQKQVNELKKEKQ
jgi:hypothetical protein